MRINKLTLGALKYIYDENKQLKSQLQQKENIIKEVREYANKYNDKIQKDILEILDKENKE